MKSVNAFALVAAGLVGSVSAFSLDFSSFAAGTELNPDLVVNVPGYGDVRFTERAGADLEVSVAFAPFKGIAFANGDQILVTFEGDQAVEIDFAFAGVGSGENVSVSNLNTPDDGTRLISFSGEGASLIAVNFDTVPEPSSTLLVALSTLGLIGRRRR